MQGDHLNINVTDLLTDESMNKSTSIVGLSRTTLKPIAHPPS